MAGDRGWLVESSSESPEHPVDGCKQDLDTVVDAVLKQEQRDANGRQTEATLCEIEQCCAGEDDGAGEHAKDGG